MLSRQYESQHPDANSIESVEVVVLLNFEITAIAYSLTRT